MKLRDFFLVVAALFGHFPVFGAPAVTIDSATTVRIYLSGASTLRDLVAGFVLNDLCGGSVANGSTTLYNVTESNPGFVFSGDYWAISCNLTALGASKIGLAANTPIAVFKSDAGGSAQGVFPVFLQEQRPFAQPEPLAGCTVVTTVDRVYGGCPSTRYKTPHIGISDIEPGLFQGLNIPKDPLDDDDDSYPTLGLAPHQQALLQITPVVQTIFGVAVNGRLYDDMFAKQGLAAKFSSGGAQCITSSTDENCIPSIGYAEVRSLFAGDETNWRLVSNNAALVDSQVNICRLIDGSGPQAAANLHLMGYPCNGRPVSPANWTASSSAAPEEVSSAFKTTVSGIGIANYLIANMGAGAGTGPMPVGTTFVFEGLSTSDVLTCLNRAHTAQGYAIGHVTKENAPGASRWKHVRLEGANPLRDSAKQGRYDYVFESTAQYLRSAYYALTAAQRAFIVGFINEIGRPDGLARLDIIKQRGVAALPTSYRGAFGTGSANDIAFGSRVTRGGDSCNLMFGVK